MYVALISCFHFLLYLEAKVEGTSELNLLCIDVVRMPQDIAPKILERSVSSASFRRILTLNQ